MTDKKQMKQITLQEFENMPKDYRSIWTIERWDHPDWIHIRADYLGKRTMLCLDKNGATVLLIEGLHFEIIDTGHQTEPTSPLQPIVGTREFMERLTSGKLTDDQMVRILALMRIKGLSFYDDWSKEHCSRLDLLKTSKDVVLEIIRTALVRLPKRPKERPKTILQTFRNKNYNPNANYDCTIIIFCQAENRPSTDWLPAKAEDINCPHLYTQGGIRYYGRR
jgi:hypothetical protein